MESDEVKVKEWGRKEEKNTKKSNKLKENRRKYEIMKHKAVNSSIFLDKEFCSHHRENMTPNNFNVIHWAV
jgi:hypothetical protein